MKLIKILTLLFVVMLSGITNAKEIIVTRTTDDTNSGSFRWAVGLVSSNDTIIINVKGIINLASTINFNVSNITIIGPYPKHNTFTSSASGINLFEFTTVNNITFKGLGFKNATVKRVIMVNNNSTDIVFESCLFEANLCSSELINTNNSTIGLLNCSFIDNSGANTGALNLINSAGGTDNNIVNCTFSGNSSTNSNGAGAILMSGSQSTKLYNNLFTYNSNSDISTSGQALYSAGASVNCTLKNNIFNHNSDGGNGTQIVGGYTSTNFDGNKIILNPGEAPYFSFPLIGSISMSNLYLSSLIEDGYGLKYFRITDQNSALVDKGTNYVSPFPLNNKDCRRAPRVIDIPIITDNPSAIDVGPCEYTPFRVTNASSSIGTTGSLPNVINNLNSTGGADNFIEFDIISYNPLNSINITATLAISNSTYIDGYSQEGTSIAGPGLMGANGVTPANSIIQITGSNTFAGYSIEANNTTIAGFELFGFQFGIDLTDLQATDAEVFGNHIGFYYNGSSYIVSENKKNGLNVGRNNIHIGGNEHWQRNVITGNGQTGGAYASNVYCNYFATNLKIFGNFIGAHPDGFSNLSVSNGTADGIYIFGNNTTPPTVNIGGALVGQRNIISSNKKNGIYVRNNQNTSIDNNYIGLSYDGLIAKPNNLNGIDIYYLINSLNIGVNKGNIISGNTQNGVKIYNSENITLVNNIIGLAKDSSIVGNSFNGILVLNSPNTTTSIFIGDNTKGNIVSGNTEQGVKVVNSDYVKIYNNRIGTTPAGISARANGFSGIQVENCDQTQIVNNLISGNTQNGVFLTSTGTNTSLEKNKIGTDVNGTSPIPNIWNGIHIQDSHHANIGLAFPDNNVIAGNTLQGVLVESPNTTIDGNIIGLDATGTTGLANGQNGLLVNSGGNGTIIGDSNGNYIGGNGVNGIKIDGADDCKINNCFIGTNINLSATIPNITNGISIQNGSFKTEIGNQFPNTIVGHNNTNMSGILIENSDSTHVINTNIGITSGNVVFPNYFGVFITGNSQHNEIGDSLGVKNIISGNNVGVLIDGSVAEQNHILGNIIGLNISATAGAGNVTGIEISNDAHHNHIGRSSFANKKNIISSNTTAGVYIHDGAQNNTIYGNLIGTNTTNDPNLANLKGIWIENCNVTNHIGSAFNTSDKPIISGNQYGIIVDGSSNQFIRNCRIGTKAGGIQALANDYGIVIQNNSSYNVIGGDINVNPLFENLISGNDSIGIVINDGDGNMVYGNKIGSTATGLSALANNKGIYINQGFKNLVGNTSTGESNLIIANLTAGIQIDNDADSTLVRNNQIGIVGIYNATGILITNSPSKFSIIGGDKSMNEGNIFIDNGVDIGVANSNFQKIEGNTFGFNQAGTASAGSNSSSIGIYLNNADNNNIGSSSPNKENSFINKAVGIFMDASNNNIITNSFIGTNINGTTSLAATNQVGIRIDSASINNTVGPNNVISGNVKGILIRSNGTNDNVIKNNKIGIDANGTIAIANTNIGINISNGAQNNTIGGVVDDQNLISGNNIGIKIEGNNTSNNKVSGNIIGLNVNGTAPIANSFGIYFSNQASANILGGERNTNTNFSETNTISGNGSAITLLQSNTNIISGNNIGNSLDGNNLIPNTAAGNEHIAFINSSNNQFGGSTSDSTNFIIGAATSALYLNNSNSNQIVGNKFGELPDGTDAGNSTHAILIDGSSNNIIGSLNPSDLINEIKNSVDDGVSIIGTSNNNIFLHNSIHSNGGLSIDIENNALTNGPTFNNTTGIQNNVQMPIILQAFDCTGDGSSEIAVDLRDLIAGDYTIEFYKVDNGFSDPTNYGEGHQYISKFNFNMPSAIAGDTLNFVLPTIVANDSITATLTALTGNGGTSEFALNYKVTDAPTLADITVITTAETCNGSGNGSFSISTSEINYTVIGVDSLINPASTVTITKPAGTYSIEIEYLNGCELTLLNQILPNGPKPGFSYIVNNDTCGLGGSIILTDTTTTFIGAGQQYTIDNGTSFQGSNTFNLSVGSYSGIFMTTTYLGVTCISDTITTPPITIVNVDLVANGEMNFTIVDFCASSSSTLNTTPTYTGGTYSITPVPGVFDANTAEISLATEGDTYTVTYAYGSCSTNQTTTAIAPIDPSFVIQSNDTICFGENYSISGPNIDHFEFATPPTDGAQIDINGQLSNYSPNTYSIRHISNSSCPDTLTKDFTILPLPTQPNITTTDSVICENENYVDIYTNPIVNVSWLRNPTDTPFLVDANAYLPQNSDIELGDNYFFAYVVDNYGCFSPYDSINIVKVDNSNMFADNDVEICLGSEVTIGANGAYSYYWPNIDNGSAEQTVTVQPNVLTNYLVILKDINGCEVFDTITVSIKDPSECDIEINTAFSPNGDGVNDTWIIKSIEGYPENIVYIYNRWGDVVAKIENYDNQQNVWNGENQLTNNIVATGTYFYVVEAGGEKRLSGWAQVVK